MVSPTGNCDSCYDILVVIHCQKMYFKHVACMGNFLLKMKDFRNEAMIVTTFITITSNDQKKHWKYCSTGEQVESDTEAGI